MYRFGGNSHSEFCDALEGLKKQLWVVDVGDRYECHDVQLEGVHSKEEMLSHVKNFTLSGNLDEYSGFLLGFGISFFHSGEIARTRNYPERIFHVGEAIRFIEKSLGICRHRGLKAELSTSLNNASSFYFVLSSLQQTREERLKSIQTALKYIEEAIEIYRDLGLKADLSGSLNNASNQYSDLFSLQQTREEKLKSIQTALKYIEEAIEIRRDLGLKAELSMSLNNASGFYSALSSLQQTREEKLKSIQTALKYIEEAIEIRRDLGLILDLADSLAISVFIYDSYLEFNTTVFSKAMKNSDEAIDIFLRFGLKKCCLLLPFGIKYHQLMYTITKSPQHQTLVQTYQQLLRNCS